MKKMMKSFRSLAPCSTTGARSNRNEEESEPKLTLVPCTSEDQKGKSVMEEEEDESMDLDDYKFEGEEWEHSIMSQSTDDERTFSDSEEIHFLSEEVTKNPDWYYTVEREFYTDLYRRAFTVTEEKSLKFARQDKIRAEFGMLLNRRPDITHESDAEDVYQKLQSEGLIRMPKNFALPSIRGAIWKRSCFHEIDQKFELVKKLIIMVPCIKDRTNIELVAEFLNRTDLARNFNDDVIFMAIDNFRMVVSEIETVFHPVIRKERIKLMIANAERECKIERRRWVEEKKQDHVSPWEDPFLEQIEEGDQSSKVYQDSIKVVQLHQEFHKHVESCNLIAHDMKIKDLVKDKRVVETRFEILEQALIIATLKARLSLLKEMDKFARYEAWLKCIVAEKVNLGRSRMDEILDMIRANHPTFPRLSDKWTFVDLEHLPRDWTNDQKEEEMSAFYGLLDKVKEYTRCGVSYGYLMEGIMEYVCVSSWLKSATHKHAIHVFDDVVRFRKKVWSEAFYDHKVYKDVYEDMFCLVS